MRSRPVIVLAVALVAGLGGGCGSTGSSDSGEEFQGQQRLVANTLEDLESAAAEADGDKICRDILARSLAERMASRGRACPVVAEAAVADADVSEITVESVQIAGDRATARIKLETGERDRTATVQLVRERGAWRIAQL